MRIRAGWDEIGGGWTERWRKSERKRGSKRVGDHRGGPLIDSHTLWPPPPSDPWTLPMSDSSRPAKLYGVCGLSKIVEFTKLRANSAKDDTWWKKRDDVELRIGRCWGCICDDVVLLDPKILENRGISSIIILIRTIYIRKFRMKIFNDAITREKRNYILKYFKKF